jgi:hypothetical protein
MANDKEFLGIDIDHIHNLKGAINWKNVPNLRGDETDEELEAIAKQIIDKKRKQYHGKR